jgi:hypothetical protein
VPGAALGRPPAPSLQGSTGRSQSSPRGSGARGPPPPFEATSGASLASLQGGSAGSLTRFFRNPTTARSTSSGRRRQRPPRERFRCLEDPQHLLLGPRRPVSKIVLELKGGQGRPARPLRQPLQGLERGDRQLITTAPDRRSPTTAEGEGQEGQGRQAKGQRSLDTAGPAWVLGKRLKPASTQGLVNPKSRESRDRAARIHFSDGLGVLASASRQADGRDSGCAAYFSRK